jgi:hypothetical protein
MESWCFGSDISPQKGILAEILTLSPRRHVEHIHPSTLALRPTDPSTLEHLALASPSQQMLFTSSLSHRLCLVSNLLFSRNPVSSTKHTIIPTGTSSTTTTLSHCVYSLGPTTLVVARSRTIGSWTGEYWPPNTLSSLPLLHPPLHVTGNDKTNTCAQFSTGESIRTTSIQAAWSFDTTYRAQQRDKTTCHQLRR